MTKEDLLVLRKITTALEPIQAEIREVREEQIRQGAKLDAILEREDPIYFELIRALAHAIRQPGSIKYVAVVVVMLTAAIWGVQLTYGDLMVGGTPEATAPTE